MGRQIVGLLVAFLVLSVLFWILQRIWPSIPRQKIFRRGFFTDSLYWLWTPIVTRAITPIAVAIILFPLARLYGTSLKTFVHGHGTLAAQPLWLQGIEIFVLGDFLGYWQHRFFHNRPLWRFHAIHHSSTELDWLSSVRLHPVNDAIGRLIVAVPLVAAGFNIGVVALYAPFVTFYAIMVHANLNWDYGPLRYAIVSPAFHRWHHTSADEGLDKNFAGAFPLWDLMFGTFYMPRRQPTVFGVLDPVPYGIIGQMIVPFRSGRDGFRSEPVAAVVKQF
jgi:sterol desaturase/sphingolipid hydroxylase (fatty acid hydroxylase superfamily)